MATFPRGVPVEDRVVRSRKDRLSAEPPATATKPKDPKFASKLPGDSLALRGIPAIGLGVQGAITGTNPDKVTRLRD